MRWADLRDEGLELVIERDGAEARMALLALNGAVPEAACKLGFTQVSCDRYVREDMRPLALAELWRVFPRAKDCEVEPASVIRTPDPLRRLRMQMQAYYGPDADVQNFEQADPDSATGNRARALSQLLGIEPVFLQYTGADPRLDFAGLALRGGGDRRMYINVDTPFPLTAVLGHEAVHVMRATQPQLYGELVAQLRPLIDAEAFARYAQRLDAGNRKSDGRGMSAEQIREEAVADIVGDMLLEPSTWESIDDRELRERVLDWLQEFLQGLIDALRRQPADKKGAIGGRELLEDLEAARSIVADALVQWRDANRADSIDDEMELAFQAGPS